VLGGRDGMPRSLGSVYAGSVTRFLGGGLRGVVRRVINTPGVHTVINGVAVSVDGSTLLVSDAARDRIFDIRVADGSLRRVIGGRGRRPRQFRRPCQVHIAPDDFVFVADSFNNRVQVLTPQRRFHGFVGVGQLECPAGVCANADVVVVSEDGHHRISVFSRGDGALLRRFGSRGSGDGQLHYPSGPCFMSDDRHVAVADCNNDRVSVFSVGGEFVRHVGVGVLQRPRGVACSAFDELVVADAGHGRVVVFSASGEVGKAMDCACIAGVFIRSGTVFAKTNDRWTPRCLVFG
jgi:DNA-binding beta-propeller fold protein YncE